jgi:hypothetical protein
MASKTFLKSVFGDFASRENHFKSLSFADSLSAIGLPGITFHMSDKKYMLF